MGNLYIWNFLAGLGFFLYGMTLLESVLKKISGRGLKIFLKKNTQSLFKSIFGGAIITGIVQSSSVVSLIVLAFVESGIIPFRNALGVILGTNLGTTLDSWIVATIGFKLNILNYAFPVIAITSIGMFFSEKRRNLYNLFSVFFALGILFLGLGFMKEGALQLVKDLDLKAFSGYGTFVFVIIGFVLTTIIQSSSATIAITLTAIYAGLITFPSAAGIVIGSEVGTTIKILLWGLKGSAEKKRVALGNFIYNIFTAFVAFVFLSLLIHVIENVFNITDPLIGLVFFQTTINVLSILIFIPFLNIFSKWLSSKFVTDNSNKNSFIGHNLSLLPVLATNDLRREAINLLQRALEFNRNILCYENNATVGILGNIKTFTKEYSNADDEYNKLKQTEGDILEYYADIQQNNLINEDARLLLSYINAVRFSVYSAKSITDISHNLNDLNESANDILHSQFKAIRNEWRYFDQTISTIIAVIGTEDIQPDIEKLKFEILELDRKNKSEILSQLKNDRLSEFESSTLMNVYQELLSCKKSLLTAMENLVV